MPLEPVTTRPVLHKGMPANKRRIAFVRPGGQEIGALLRMPPDWTVSLFVEAEFYRYLCVGVSPDLEELRIERWVPAHAPTILEAATQAEQAAALGGSHAGNATAAELADAAFATLTAGDTPTAVPARQISLAPIVARAVDSRTGGDYRFRVADEGGPNELRLLTCFVGILRNRELTTKGLEAQLAGAFAHTDGAEAYFLFDTGTDYLLESLRFWGSRFQRCEFTGPKASFPGTPETAVTAMIPSLAPDQP